MFYKPLVWLFRYTGVAPLGTRWDKYISIAALFVNITMCVLTILTLYTELHSIVYTTRVACYVASYLGYLSLIFHNFIYRRSYQMILNDLRIGDEELRRMDASPSPTVIQQRMILCTCVCFYLSSALCNLVEGVPISRFFLRETASYVTLNIGLIQHLVLVSQLHSLFSSLNVRLEQFSSTADDTPVNVMSTQLESIFRIHTHLHKTVADVNGHYFIYNLMLVVTKVILFVSYLYNFLLSVSDEDIVIPHGRTLKFLTHILFFIIQCVFCHACAKEANRTVLLAHYILQPHTPHRLWKEVSFFSGLCIGNKVHFTVGEIFNLDRPLITKAAVLAFTYLVVAVQLQDVQLFGEETPQHDANVTAFEYFNTTNESSTHLFH